jgi:hypothetical protein
MRLTVAQLLQRLGDFAAAADAFDHAALIAPGPTGERWRREARALRTRLARDRAAAEASRKDRETDPATP